MSKFKIGDVELKNNVVLAPMAGVCNPAFRLIAKEFGTGLVCAEMVSDKAVLHGNKKTMKMLFVDEREKPLSLQIFGGEKESLVAAAKYVDENTNADIIDINMGCPVPKVVSCDAGAKWLLQPSKIEEMVSAVVENVSKPVTVKMRIGWDEDHIYAVENAKAVERAGGSAVAVHGRTRVQMYEGQANWDVIRDVKQNVKIPVIGNGDVFTPEDAKSMLDLTGCDGVMIGRGALGNPWMLYRTVHFLTHGELLGEPTPKEKIDVCLLHMDRLIHLKGERVAIQEMRKHAAWYLKGLKHSATVRQKINEVDTKRGLQLLLEGYVEQLQAETVVH
ncbi:tRNA dihydrouridine synthase DusB [Ammoniphilus oxalaticus]|uniref:tRNA-dihydrouridine synthase n=2 Tax=Ammoniphilus oxalaticus TaxID=66863 RepID=A0A419SG55_9BACL|nr:tRNA dihydrouridine synthase DusB [Ammoniphilus oxalaticus]RKD22771.1 tRNA dihydrouridine synthase DusB [Ammoniphilus oxalaticus]